MKENYGSFSDENYFKFFLNAAKSSRMWYDLTDIPKHEQLSW